MLRANRLKCNIEKSYFGQTEMEYLGFWVNWTGIWPINKKVEAIVNMMPPKNQKQVCSFIGLVNYYRDIWAKQSHLLQPLTILTSKKVKFKWTVVEQKSFNEIKQIFAHNTLFTYPDFNKCFDINMVDSEYQLVSVIGQYWKPISFYSCKLTGPQAWYTVMKKELLSIVKT